MRLTFENFVNQEVNMMFFENMWYFLKQRIKWNSGFIVSFLSHFKKFFKILNLKEVLIDNVSEETLRFFDKLHMTVYKINFFKNFALFDPLNLNKKKNTIFLFLPEPNVKVFTISLSSLSPCNLFFNDSCSKFCSTNLIFKLFSYSYED